MKRLWFLLLFPLLAAGGQQTVPFATGAIASGSSNPSPVTGMNIWYSADCITFTSSVCGTPSNGSTINTWADRSGNANNVTIAAGTATFNTNQINGLPAVTFSSSCEGNISSPVSASNGHTAFAVFQTPSTAGTFFGSTTGGFGWGSPGMSNAQKLDRQNLSNVGVATNFVSGTNYYQINVAMTNAASTFSIGFRMSSATDVISSSTSSSISGGTLSTIGYDPVGTPSAFFTGKIVELIYYNTTLTLVQIQQNEAYFRFKYGIS